MNDLGVEDSSESILDRFFDEGSKILTSGWVINPNTCIDPTTEKKVKKLWQNFHTDKPSD